MVISITNPGFLPSWWLLAEIKWILIRGYEFIHIIYQSWTRQFSAFLKNIFFFFCYLRFFYCVRVALEDLSFHFIERLVDIMTSSVVKFSTSLSKTDPITVPVLIVGQEKHLSTLPYSAIKCKLEPRVNEQVRVHFITWNHIWSLNNCVYFLDF